MLARRPDFPGARGILNSGFARWAIARPPFRLTEFPTQFNKKTIIGALFLSDHPQSSKRDWKPQKTQYTPDNTRVFISICTDKTDNPNLGVWDFKPKTGFRPPFPASFAQAYFFRVYVPFISSFLIVCSASAHSSHDQSSLSLSTAVIRYSPWLVVPSSPTLRYFMRQVLDFAS